MSTPKYFITVFGEPNPPGKDTIESGIYHPDQRSAPFAPQPGDVLLLYCTASYPGHEMEVPGIGIVTGVDDEAIHYRFLPLSESIPKHHIDQCLEEAELAKFKNLWLSTYWLFEIPRNTFARAVGTQHIAWP